jgi:hypothetical protein
MCSWGNAGKIRRGMRKAGWQGIWETTYFPLSSNVPVRLDVDRILVFFDEQCKHPSLILESRASGPLVRFDPLLNYSLFDKTWGAVTGVEQYYVSEEMEKGVLMYREVLGKMNQAYAVSGNRVAMVADVKALVEFFEALHALL